MNNKPNLLEQAKEIISKIDRENDGVSIEEAANWLDINRRSLFLKYPKEAVEIFDTFFDLFRQRFPDANDLTLQYILSLAIADEEDVDSDVAMVWLTESWAKCWRNYLQKNGIEIRGIEEDKNACRLTQSRLWTLINRYRREKGMVDLQHHYDHAKNAALHSGKMAERNELFQSLPYYFQIDKFLIEDVIEVPFKRPNGTKEAAREIFNQIIEKGNVSNPEFTGVGIGLWMGEGNIIYTTLRYSKICCAVKKSFTKESV